MPVTRILCIRFSSLGDLLLTAPVYTALRQRYPGALLTLVTKQAYQGFMEGHPALDEILYLPHQGNVTDLWRLGAIIRLRQFDIVIDLHGSMRSRILTLLSGCAIRLRYRAERRCRTELVKRGYAQASPATPVVKRYVQVLQKLGVTPVDIPITLLRVLDADTAWAYSIVGQAQQKPLIAISPGGRHGAKQWPAEHVHTLCTLLASRYRLLILDTDHLLSADAFLDMPQVSFLQGHLKAGHLIALLAQSNVLVTSDSGPMHLAGAVGTSVVALFGPTHPALGFAPIGSPHRILHSGRQCSPCSLHGSAPCKLGLTTCMSEITPACVAQEITFLLK